MADRAFIVYFTVALINFLASIVQGVTGFGDAIILQILWYTVTVMAPSTFNTTPLGAEPVHAITLVMYVKAVFTTPLVIFLCYRDSIFSKTMISSMAVASCITSLAGMVVFSKVNDRVLKLVLGFSNLGFAVIYALLLIGRTVMNHRFVKALVGTPTPEKELVEEVEVVAQQFSHSANTSFSRRSLVSPPAERPPEEFIDIFGDDPAGDRVILATASGAPYTLREAMYRPIMENGVEQVTPPTTRMLTPTRTLTYTRVRVNRNLNSKGKIKLSAKIMGTVAAGVSGLLGSMTGVSAPPQIIFILAFDIPGYIMRGNFCTQSLLSAALRFVVACTGPLFHVDMIPIFVTSVLVSYGGIFAGVWLGKLLGPRSYNLCVLSVLLLSSATMITANVELLLFLLGSLGALTIIAGWCERSSASEAVNTQLAMEVEIESTYRAATVASEAASLAVQGGDNTRSTSFSTTRTSSWQQSFGWHRSFAGPKNFSAAAVVALHEEQPRRIHSVSEQELIVIDDTASMASLSTCRSSTRIRKADLHRPPSIFAEVDRAERLASLGCNRAAVTARSKQAMRCIHCNLEGEGVQDRVTGCDDELDF